MNTIIKPIIKGEGGIQNYWRQEDVEESLCCEDGNGIITSETCNKTETCKN